jgi:hypothetical protein
MVTASTFVCQVRDTIEIQFFTLFYLVFHYPHSVSLKVLCCLTWISQDYISRCESARLLHILDIDLHYWEPASIEFHGTSPRRHHVSRIVARDHNTTFTFSPLLISTLLDSITSLPSSILHNNFASISSFSTVQHHESSILLIHSPSPQGLDSIVSAGSRLVNNNTSLSQRGCWFTSRNTRINHFTSPSTLLVSFFLYQPFSPPIATLLSTLFHGAHTNQVALLLLDYQ